MLTNKAVVDEIERVLEHSLSGRALPIDHCAPLKRDLLEVGVWHYFVDRSHLEHLFRAVFAAQEKDLACKLLPDLASEIGRSETTVEARNIGIGLFELCMLGTRQRQIAYNVKTVTSTGGPTGHDTDHDFRHESNQSLNFENVEPAATRGINRVRSLAVGVLVAVLPADSLVSARAECPTTISR